MSSRTFCLISVLVAGCGADLRRVHTPDLLTVDEHLARKCAGGCVRPGAKSTVTAKPTWQLHSTLEAPQSMLDGDTESVSIAADPGRKDQYILVDLGRMCWLQKVTQTHPGDFGQPRRYRIDVAGEHNFPYKLQFVGEGYPGCSVAVLRRPVQCRFLRITLMETCEQAWAVAELDIE